MHKNHQIYERAVKLLENYFNTEGPGDDLMGMIQQHQGADAAF